MDGTSEMTVTEEVLEAVDVYSALIRGGKTPEQSRKQIARLFDQETARSAIRRHEEEAGRIRRLRDPASLTEGLSTAWYTGPAENDLAWPALKHYLLETKSWPSETVDALDQSTTKVLSLMAHPGMGEITTQGLVVGYVQSGKTANYTSLIAKATDVGYRLVVVLAGIHNSLRKQTQLRLQRELVDLNPKHWFALTEGDDDFRGNSNATAFLAEEQSKRILLVVKKNAVVLRRLKDWLESCDDEVLRRCPTLIIDDEADQAGLNSARNCDDRTKINELLLGVLGNLPKRAYVGYTATPFANVLVNPDPAAKDLYPKDFIVSLPRPVGYFGAEGLFGILGTPKDENDFGDAGYDMIRIVPDDERGSLQPRSRSERDGFDPRINDSLGEALQYFLLACSARRARGHEDHFSMLIHTTLYTEPHEKIARAVEAFWTELKQSILLGDESLLSNLKSLWVAESERVSAESFGNRRVEFEELAGRLSEICESAEIVVENGKSELRLQYDESPKIQIAIGGNSLSRGLTLEGLMVSYFLRTATAYDTLLQMGRWFGFRRGYEDLPRVWMTGDLQENFSLLSLVESEIREDISRYASEELKPTDFPVRVRKHPSLAITSPLKMRHAIDVDMSFSGQTRQSMIFKHKDRAWLQHNIEATERLLAELGQPESAGHNYLFRGVPAQKVLEFLRDYSFHSRHTDLAPEHLCGYIEKQLEHGALGEWSVALVGRKKRLDHLGAREFSGLKVNLVNRAQKFADTGDDHANVGTITTQSFFQLDKPSSDEGSKSNKREIGDSPILVLVPVSKNSMPATTKKRALDAVDDIVGVAVQFPEAEHETAMSFVAVDLPQYFEDEDEFFNEVDDV